MFFAFLIQTEMDKKYGLGKEERIHSKKEIEKLFSNGHSFISYPLRTIFFKRALSDEIDERKMQVSIMVSVPKRKFKRAVKRNRIKRLIKESFRLNKSELYEQMSSPESVSIAFLYAADEEKTFHEIDVAMKKALGILKSKLQ